MSNPSSFGPPAPQQQPDNRVIWMVAAAVVGFALILSVGTVVTVLVISRKGASTSTDTRISGNIDGSCSANGINNTIRCDALGPSNAHIAIQEGLEAGVLWFDGPAVELPSATQFKSGAACTDPAFMAWARSQDRIYVSNIDKKIFLSSGDPDLVTLTAADAVLMNWKDVRPEQGTWIKCGFGGGGITYHHELRIDTQRQSSTLASGPGDGETQLSSPLPMPPASVSLKERSEAIVLVNADSKQDRAYIGYVGLTASANGKPVRLTLGDPKTPLRWTGFYPQDGDDYYSVNSEGNWTRNWTPGCEPACLD